MRLAIQRNRELFRKYHGRQAPQMMITDFCMAPDPGEAEDTRAPAHGEIRRKQFPPLRVPRRTLRRRSKAMTPTRKRRRSRAKAGSMGRSSGLCRRQFGVRPTASCGSWKRGAMCLGEFELNTAFRFGGVPFDIAERKLKMFAKEVLPVLKTWRGGKSSMHSRQRRGTDR